jgi:hypothetical protein
MDLGDNKHTTSRMGAYGARLSAAGNQHGDPEPMCIRRPSLPAVKGSGIAGMSHGPY